MKNQQNHAKITKITEKLNWIFVFALFALSALVASRLSAAPATAPAEAKVSPEAAALLEEVKQAYTKLSALEHSGKITGEFDVDGQQQNETLDFTSTFAAPNLFRMEIQPNDVIGSTGERLYVYMKQRNVFLTADAPRTRVAGSELPAPFGDLIHSQDPSLGMAISADPAADLARDFSSVEKIDDVKLGDATYDALKLQGKSGQGEITMLFDPASHLIRRVNIDLAPQLRQRGAGEVKKAQVTIDYTSNKTNPATQPQQFAWTPPAGARDAAEEAGAGGDAEQLVGKPAPAFKLKNLEDKEIALADHKGQVVVLDFWATWCGPCVAALPKLDAMAKELKDEGVTFYAVNGGEEKELVSGFMTSKNLTIPALLDQDMKVAESYHVEAIPQTVVIDKNGVVRKVFVGAGPDMEARLREAIKAAMAAQ